VNKMPGPRRRIAYLSALSLTVAMALCSRRWPIGWYPWDKSLGDALYAAAAYFLLRLAWPALAIGTAAILTLAFCAAVEAFKFTGLPAAWSGWHISRLLLGTTPSWHNVLCYVVATLSAAVLERVENCLCA